ncbi:glycosyltransferase family 4 protein [Planctomycetaceae bacterium SH139]
MDSTRNSMLRVAQFVSGREIDGASRHAVTLSRILAARGHHVDVYCRRDSWVYQQVDALRKLSSKNIALTPCDFRRNRGALKATSQWLVDTGIQLTHSHKTSACHFSSLIRWFARIPSVATAHHQSFQLHWFAHDRIIAPSQATARYLRRRHWVPARRVVIIPYPQAIDWGSRELDADHRLLRDQFAGSSSAFLIAVLGSVEPRKDLLTLVRAVGELRNFVPAMQIIAAGGLSPKYVGKLKREAAAWNIADRLHLLGPRNDVAAIMRQVDVVCLPSRHEQLPLSILEAMVMGKPVLVTPVGGLPDLIRDGVDGLLAPVGQPSEWAERLARLAESDDLRAKLGAAGQQRVAQYCHETKRVEDIEDVYHGVLDRSPQASGTSSSNRNTCPE